MKRTIALMLCLASIALIMKCTDDAAEEAREKNIMMGYLVTLGPILLANKESGICPFPPTTTVLPPGTYTISLNEGDVYWFDPTVRQMYYHAWYTFNVSESPGLNVRLYFAECKSGGIYYAANDSGSPGMNEELIVDLYGDYNIGRMNICYFKALTGSGSITFTVPSDKSNVAY